MRWPPSCFPCGVDSGDRAWQLPLWDDYQSQLKSNFADMTQPRRAPRRRGHRGVLPRPLRQGVPVGAPGHRRDRLGVGRRQGSHGPPRAAARGVPVPPRRRQGGLSALWPAAAPSRFAGRLLPLGPSSVTCGSTSAYLGLEDRRLTECRRIEGNFDRPELVRPSVSARSSARGTGRRHRRPRTARPWRAGSAPSAARAGRDPCGR